MKPAFWRDRHVVITGGTSGIGLAVAEKLVAMGARLTVFGLDDRHARNLAARNLPHLLVLPTDVTDPGQVAEAFTTARDHHGAVRSLITCAGIVRPGYFEQLGDEDLRRHMEVNYFGTVIPIRQALSDLLAGPGSTLTCVASAAGLVGVFGYGAYSPSKFAVRGLCEVLRQEYKPRGLTVTGVYPLDVDTPMLESEQLLKPAELIALSDGSNPMKAEAVARALINGTEAGRATVVPGIGAKALRWAAGISPGLFNRYVDSKISTARSNRLREQRATI
jgi:3-dehydrosphinganine reductase